MPEIIRFTVRLQLSCDMAMGVHGTCKAGTFLPGLFDFLEVPADDRPFFYGEYLDRLLGSHPCPESVEDYCKMLEDYL